MASDDLESSPSAGKHRRSPHTGDAAAEESSKRRKHHHRHHHHRHHRRHSKHGHDRGDGDELPLAAAAVAKPGDDDEREEGEILEEEEGEIRSDPGRDSGVDAGEIEIEREAVDSIVTNLSEKSSIRSCNYTSMKGDEKMEDLSVVEKIGEIDIPYFRLTLNDDDETRSDLEARHRRQKSRTRGTDKENEHRDADTDDLKSRARSRSPVSGENSRMPKHERKNEVETRAVDNHSERLEKRRHPESWSGDRKSSDGNSRFKDTKNSPEARHRDRSRSHDHKRDHKRERSFESGREPNVDSGARSHNLESQVNSRSDPEHQHSVRHDRADRYVVRSRDDNKDVHKERERIISHSRYDRPEDRHHSRDRGSERERYSSSVRERESKDRGSERERYSSSIRERDSKEGDKYARRERERSSSYSRRDGREDRHSSRDRGLDRERYSSSARDNDRDKPRDTSRERYKEREMRRAGNSERERPRSSVDRDSSRGNDRDYREQREQMEKNRIGNRDLRHNDSRHSKYDEKEHHNDRRRLKDDKSDPRNTEEGNERSTREDNEEVYLERIEEELAKHEEDDVDKIKEESRKRRQAILEKYKQQQMQQRSKSPCSDHDKEKHAPADKDNQQQLDAGNAASQAIHKDPENEHDPSDLFIVEPSFTVGKSDQNGASDRERIAGAGGLGEGTPKSERSADMFCDDDIFGESPAGVRKHDKGDDVQVVRSGLHDNWDDAEGYYSYRLGEVLDGHFEIKAFHGKGVFSTVIRAKDLKAGKGEPEEVAIKIIRNNDTMYKAGLEELVILKKLAGADPEDKRHCVRFLSSFKYRNHLCLVFESLHMNLREVLKKFGRNIGLNLTAVRAYAKQLFIALKHLRNCGVLHCDIKPDNMLVNEAKNVLKLCDFGNAMFAGKNEITPYLVSRFYRAPEIILGLPYDHPMDIWSVGCCLYEIYTGKVLFPGPSNNDMLRLHMELKGPFPKKMLRKGGFTDRHFDQDLNFHASEEDPVTKKSMKRLILSIKPKEIGTIISSSPGEDPKLLASFKDLLERIFILDPEKRMTVAQALSHPFITGK